MNTRKLLIVAAFAAAFSGASTAVLAQEATPELPHTFSSQLTRADVQADLFKARADGSIRFSRAGFIEPLRTSQPREAVRQQTLAALASGELKAIQGEVYAWAPARAVLVAGAAR